jgi:uncharacterized protein (DUF1330 family)
MIYFCEGVTDRKELEIYWEKIGATFAGHEVKLLAGYTPFEILEGSNIEGVVVAEFPTMEAARGWYHSPAYRAIRHHRTDNAKYVGLLVEGGVAPVEQRLRNRIPHR